MRFVVFAEDWAQHPSSTQHLFRLISERYNTTWVNSIGMRTPKFNWVDMRRILSKALMMAKSWRSKGKNTGQLNVVNPFLLPWHKSKTVRAFNQHQISQLIDFNNEEPITYWLSVPNAISLITLRPQDKVVYYCGDDFSALAGVEHNMISKFEKKLIDKADLIFVASEVLLEKMPTHKTQLLEHGVDFDLFAKRKAKHPVLRNRNRVVGFYGSISNWLDIDLLYALAVARPEYDIVLVGRNQVDIERLTALENVIHVGEVPHAELAQFSQYWQVSVLPFIINEQIRACDPLKLKEYLAAGKPIVATRFPAVERFSSIIMVANNQEEFIARIDDAMAIDGPNALGWRDVSQSYVHCHSWQHKRDYVLAQLI